MLQMFLGSLLLPSSDPVPLFNFKFSVFHTFPFLYALLFSFNTFAEYILVTLCLGSCYIFHVSPTNSQISYSIMSWTESDVRRKYGIPIQCNDNYKNCIELILKDCHWYVIRKHKLTHNVINISGHCNNSWQCNIDRQPELWHFVLLDEPEMWVQNSDFLKPVWWGLYANSPW